MARRHIRAKTAEAAKNKAKGKGIVVSKVNLIPGTKGKGGLRTYDVTTHKRKT